MKLFKFLTSKKVSESISDNRPRTSSRDRMVVDANNSTQKSLSKYAQIVDLFGKQDVDWKLQSQWLASLNSKSFHVLNILTKDGGKKSVYFSIS